MAFVSGAALLPDDTNGVADVFVYDRTNCALELASISSAGVAADAPSQSPSISSDGRFVAFVTGASTLVDGDANGVADAFVRDRQTGVTERVSLTADGSESAGAVTDAKIAGNGMVVAFVSTATDLVSGDTNGIPDLFVRDRAMGATERVSVASDGAQGLLVPFPLPGIMAFSIANGGDRIAFVTIMKGLVADDTNDDVDVFVRDRATGFTSRVSVASDGTQANGGSWDASISGDGTMVAFESGASNLVAGDDNGLWEVFVRDVDAQTTTRLTAVNQGGAPDSDYWRPIVSGTGRYVAFLSSASNLVAGDANGVTDVFVHDRQTAITRRVTTSELGIEANDYSFLYDLSDDGQIVGFTSSATTLVDEDVNAAIDAFSTRWAGLSAPPDVDLIRNGSFDAAAARWSTFGAPDASQMVSQVQDAVFEFRRAPAPGGAPAQAVVFQATTAQLLPFAALEARFDLGNTGNDRRRISVVLHDADFNDVAVCTFWLAPLAPTRTYLMRAHTTERWSGATISFYAATGTETGLYRVDDVSLKYRPSQPPDRTECADASAPAPQPGGSGPTLLTNGDFGAGASGWSAFGQIVWQIDGGVFEFYRPAGTPTGVVLQASGQSLSQNDIVTATFDLGNSSAVRKRVTVLLHGLDFSDLHACTFTLPPHAPLTTFAMRTYASAPWSNATISFYAATVGTDPFVRLDNVALQRTPAATALGTECLESATPADIRPTFLARGRTVAVQTSERAGLDATVDEPPGQAAGGGAAPAPMQFARQTFAGTGAVIVSFESRRPAEGAALVQISADGQHWTTVADTAASDDWLTYAVELPHVEVPVLLIRFLYVTADGTASDDGSVWAVRDVRIGSAQPANQR
jgi:Tol biopolymer transport system component